MIDNCVEAMKPYKVCFKIDWNKCEVCNAKYGRSHIAVSFCLVDCKLESVMDPVTRLSVLKRSILRHSCRRSGASSHVIMPDEHSETAQKWVETIKLEALRHKDEMYPEIPFIDDCIEEKHEPAEENNEQEIDSAPKKRIQNLFRMSKRRKSVVECEELRSSLYEKRMMRSATFAGGGANQTSQECSLSIIGRSETVVEQAEAKRAFKRRNSIKKRMMKKLGKSIENITPKSSKTQNVERSKLSRKEHSTRMNTTENEDDIKVVSSVLEKQKSKEKKLVRSMSDVGLAKITSLKLRRKSTVESKNRKSLIKDWKRTYEDMCSRAQKLDLAIKIAQTEELEVKPVNSFLNKSQDDKTRWQAKMATEGSFYSLQSVTSSDTEIWEDTDEGTNAKKMQQTGSVNNISDFGDNRRRAFQTRTQSLIAMQ